MLKFFRQYNKHILVVGGCLLMISFLLEPVLNRCQQSQFTETLGRVDGRSITTDDVRKASAEIGMLNALSPMLSTRYEPLQWILILHDSKKLGLSASKREAEEIIQNSDVNSVTANEIMRQYGVTFGELIDAIRNWSTVQQYQSLALGVEYMSPVQRIKQMREGQFSFPSPPMSEPMVKRFVYDQRAEVSITGVEVPATLYQTEIKQPTAEEIKALYEQYKDNLPGEGKPFGYGYKLPDRVKLEYLRFPYERAKEAIVVEEVDIYAHYERNKDNYIIPVLPPEIPVIPAPIPAPDSPLVPPASPFEKVQPKTPEKTAPKTEEKPAPKAEEKPAPKVEEKPAPKVEEKPAPKAEEKPAPKAEEKAPPKVEEPAKLGCGEGEDTKAKDGVAPAVDAPKADAPKADAPKVDAPKADAPKADAPKTDRPPTIAPKRDLPVTAPPVVPAGPKYRPYEDVRADILSDLKEQRARELVRKMVEDSREILLRDARRLPVVEGYYDTSAKDFTTIALSDVAAEIQKRHKILPTVVRLDSEWLDEAAIKKLPEFGEAIIPTEQGQFGVTVSEYIMSTRELLEPESKNRLINRRLQLKLPSLAVTDLNGMFIFRVTDAQKSRPATFEERKDDVERDARKVAAYRILEAKAAEWVTRAKAEKIEDIARLQNATVITSTFRKRELDFFGGGGLQVPTIAPIGKSELLVDHVYDTAEKAIKDGTLEGVPAADRAGAVAIPERMSLVVFRIDLFKPITKAELETVAGRPQIGELVARGMFAVNDDTPSPLSIESLSKRVGYVSENEGKAKETKDAAKDAAAKDAKAKDAK